MSPTILCLLLMAGFGVGMTLIGMSSLWPDDVGEQVPYVIGGVAITLFGFGGVLWHLAQWA